MEKNTIKFSTVRPKKRQKYKTDQKKNLIVGQMWLGILSDLPLFYQTCRSVRRYWEKLKSPAVWACLGVYPLDMPRTPYRASEGKRSQ